MTMPQNATIARAAGAMSLLLLASACGGGGDGSTGPAPVTVQSVAVSPSTLSLHVGETMSLHATARDAQGAAISGKTFSWSSQSSSVATVSTSGVVSAVAVGAATITAATDGKTGSATVTVEAPSANSVDVTPSTATISAGDTLRLSATVRDAQGNILTGSSVAWTSSDGAVATVSSAGTVTAVAAGSATITATSNGKMGQATVTVQALPRLELDSGHATSATVSSAGATLSAVSGGVTYRLTVPPGAIPGSLQLTMTPVSIERDLPVGGSFVGGVAFGPTGTTFLKPLTLTMVSHVVPPTGQVIVGYMADDTGAVTELTASTRATDSLTLTVRHFSVGGWGQFVQGNVPLIPLQTTSAGNAAFESQLAILDADPGANSQQYAAVFAQWYSSIIAPELVSANATHAFTLAADDFSEWDQALKLADAHFAPGDVATLVNTQRLDGISRLPRVVNGAISGDNASCAAAPPFVYDEAVAAFIMQDIAKQLGVATVANGLDDQSFLAGFCLQVVNTQADFPATPPLNQPSQLDLRYGVKFGTSVQLQDALFKVTMDLTGTTTDGQQVLQTDNQGKLSGSVELTGNSDFDASMKTCIHPSVGYRMDEVCLNHSVQRSMGRTIDADVVVVSQVGLAQLAGVSRINGNLIIGSGITSSDLSELSQLTTVIGALEVIGATSVHSFSGLANLRVAGSLKLTGMSAVSDLSPLSHLPQLSTLNLGGMPQVTSLSAFHNTAWDGLVLDGMNGLTTLNDLQEPPSIMPGALQLTNNTQLFDASIFKHVVSVGRAFDVHGNPLFTTLNDFAALGTVTGNFTVGGNGLASAAGLNHLTHVGGSLTLMVNDLDAAGSFDLPSLTDVGEDLVINQSRTQGGSPPASVLTVNLGALATIGRDVGGSGSAAAGVRHVSLSLSGLQSMSAGLGGGGTISNIRGLQTLVLGPVTTPGFTNIEVFGDDDLQTLVIGAVHAGGSIEIDQDAALTSVQFAAGFSAGEYLEIDNNPLLATVTFAGGFTIGESLEIDNNPALLSIAFAGGTVGNNVEIDLNASLTSITGPIGLVGNNLEVDQNPSLSNAAATAWANGITVGGLREVNNNKNP